MSKLFKSILFTVLLGFFTVASAQETPVEGKEFLGVPIWIWVWPLISTALYVAWMTWGDHIAPSERIRNSIAALLSVGIVGSGVYYVEETIEITVAGEIKIKFEKAIKHYIQADTLGLKDMQKAIMDSQDTIKILLAALPDTLASKSTRDSLFARMELLDTCIDRHFAGTRQRLIRIEEKLE